MDSRKGDPMRQLAESAAEAAELLKSLSHEYRLMMLCFMADGERSVQDFETLLGASQSNVSQHLARMRDKGIVGARRDGKNVYYSIKDARAHEVVRTLQRLFCP